MTEQRHFAQKLHFLAECDIWNNKSEKITKRAKMFVYTIDFV